MFTSSVSSVVTHVLFFHFNIPLWMLLLTRHLVISCLFFILRGLIILQRGERKVTAMIMLTSSEDVCQSSIIFARMNVMAGSLYEESTRIEEVRRTNCSEVIRQHITGNTECATHICGERVHMWTGLRHVSNFLLSPLQFARPQSPPAPDSK